MKVPLALFAFLALTPAAAPVSNTELSPSSFTQAITDGLWLVEYYSPYCHHCREFAPTWASLEKSSDPGIHLAQVNCAVHGDFCKDNGVQAYPQIQLYSSGSFVERYTGSRDLGALQAYIQQQVEPSRSRQPVHIQTSRVDANPSGTVLELDPTDFDQQIKRGPVFVKFFAPWCGHCKKLAPTWVELAQNMQSKLDIAQVNCELHSAFCTEQQIQGYPTLVFYSNGDTSEYTGGRKLAPLMAFANAAIASPLQVLADSDVEAQVNQHPVIYLLLHTASDLEIVDQIEQASRVLLGTPPVYSSSSPEFFSRYHIPASSPWALLALKNHDSAYPTARLYPTSPEPLKDWLLSNRIPTSLELTADSFQQVMKAPHQPLVVIAAVTPNTKDKVSQKMQDIGKMWNRRKAEQEHGSGRDVIFTWMDADKWATWLKNMYSIKMEPHSEPAIVVTDHARLLFYDLDQTGRLISPTFTSVSSTIDAISSGKVHPKHSENHIERMARYLNYKLTYVEMYVVDNPLKALFFLAAALVLAFFGIKYFVAGDANDHPSKSTRLD